MKQFEHAIQTIASKVTALNPGRLAAEIRDTDARVNELHQRIAALDHGIAGFAAKHMTHIRLNGREITPEELARSVFPQQDQHGWLDDTLDPKANATQLFGNAEVGALRQARLRIGQDLPYLACTLPAADSFPDEQSLLGLHKICCVRG
jgi:hypothetical protein